MTRGRALGLGNQEVNKITEELIGELQTRCGISQRVIGCSERLYGKIVRFTRDASMALDGFALAREQWRVKGGSGMSSWSR